MIRSLIGLPFRLGARLTGAAVHGTTEVADRAFGLVGVVSNALSGPRRPDVDLDGSPHDGGRSSAGSQSGPQPAPRVTPSSPRTTSSPQTTSSPRTTSPESSASTESSPSAVAPAPAPPPPPAPAAPPPPLAAPEVDTPGHVSEEPTLVESVAEIGAEDGAGAQINVAEPWDGYRAMKANDIVDRIAGADNAVLAAVELYELSGRKRQSILAAVERELKRPPGQS